MTVEVLGDIEAKAIKDDWFLKLTVEMKSPKATSRARIRQTCHFLARF